MGKFYIYTPSAFDDFDELRKVEFEVNPDHHLKSVAKFTFKYNDYKEHAKFMKNVNIVGALLSFDGNIFTIWNTNLNQWNPYDENISQPSDRHGDVIAVCVGKGMWCYTGFAAATMWGNHKWAPNTTNDLYTLVHTQTLIEKSGYLNTKHIYNVHGTADINNTIWGQIKSSDYVQHDKLIGMLYIPSYIELAEMQQNISKRYTGDTLTDFFPFDYGLMNIGHLIFKQELDPTYKAVTIASSSEYCVSKGKYIASDFRTGATSTIDKATGDVYLVAFISFE